VARNQTEDSDKQCRNRKASHRASLFNFAQADSVSFNCDLAPEERKLYLIVPSGMRASNRSVIRMHGAAFTNRPVLQHNFPGRRIFP
jgi:hypothetical protein